MAEVLRDLEIDQWPKATSKDNLDGNSSLEKLDQHGWLEFLFLIWKKSGIFHYTRSSTKKTL